MLPPGRDRLATCPLPSGSAWLTKTIGMVEVARLRRSGVDRAWCNDNIDLGADQLLLSQRVNPLEVALRP